MSVTTTVRRATVCDLDVLFSLVILNRSVFGILLRQHLSDELSSGLAVPRKCWLIAELDGAVVGAIYCFHSTSGLSYPNYLCVSPQAKGHGIGALLLAAIEQQAQERGQKGLKFQCPEGNSANALYRRLGYTHAGRERATHNYLNNWERLFHTSP